MKDFYFYKSLFVTSIVYLLLLGALVTFIVITGIVGLSVISVLILVLLAYFYK